MSLFQKTYFIGLMILGFAALFYFTAHAQEGSDTDIQWYICADTAMRAFIEQGPQAVEKQICQGLFQLDPGPECKDSARALMELGMLENEASKYFYQNVMVPKCGEHPQE